jgi:hypothetical protein
VHIKYTSSHGYAAYFISTLKIMFGCPFIITVISEDLLDCEELVEAIICAISILFSLIQITK